MGAWRSLLESPVASCVGRESFLARSAHGVDREGSAKHLRNTAHHANTALSGPRVARLHPTPQIVTAAFTASNYQTLVLLALVLAGCHRPPATPKLAFSGVTMGTSYHIKLAELPPGLTVANLQHEVDQRLETIERQMSTYRADSELSRFNRCEGSEWFPVSADTALVVTTALEVGQQTDGLFDVTVGPLVNLWGFGPPARRDTVPTVEQLAAARERVGQQYLQSRQTPPALRKLRPGVYVDLSAIAKGFAVDQVAQVCDRHHLADYLVEIGGEVRASGHRPDGSWWRIGIEQPLDGARAIGRVVELDDRSLATSGDYRNFFAADGQRYSHEIDPRTGRPVTHSLASVSVLADHCMRADALATALMIMGPDEAYRFAEEHQLAVLLMVRVPNGFKEKSTPGFAARSVRNADLPASRSSVSASGRK